MKKNEVKVGGLYTAKVSDRIVTVRIDSTHSGGGWNATNTATGKRIRIKSAQRLRGAAGKTMRNGTPETTVANDEKPEVPGATGKTTKAKAPKTADIGETTVQPDVPGRDDEKDGTRDGTEAAVANGEKAGTPEAAVANNEKAEDPVEAAKVEERNDRDTDKAPRSQLTLEEAAKLDKVRAAKAKKAKPKKANGDAPAEQKPKHVGALEAAAQVLAEAGKPMRARELVAAMAEQGLWSSPAGKTPHATLYAAMMREARDKGGASRFRKADRGLFEFNKTGS